MAQAILMTEENLDYIVAYGQALEFNLDYVKYALEDAADFGTTIYCITSGSKENNNITFTDMWKEDFDRIWKFKSTEDPTKFTEIERIN